MHNFLRNAFLIATVSVVWVDTTSAKTVNVRVFDYEFSANADGLPNLDPVIDVGDTIHWIWESPNHSVTSVLGQPETFNSGIRNSGTFDHIFTNVGVSWYFCVPHGSDRGNGTAVGMAGIITTTYVGDANIDFKVDLLDFSTLKTNFLTGTTRAEGDYNADSVVDLNDFNLLKANFGQGTSAVPEPSAWLLTSCGLIVFACLPVFSPQVDDPRF